MTESKQEGILRKVRALIAKANATTFEGERMAFLAKADELMEAYAIDEAMLLLADDPNVKLVTRKDMDFSWWAEIRKMDRDAYSEIYYLWLACVAHCRCVSPGIAESTFNWVYDGSGQRKAAHTVPVYGTESDLAYLDLLFTDLFLQMSAKLKPSYDSEKTMGHNIAIAKQAGMKYADIAVWIGRPDWVENGKCIDHGIMARAYKEYVQSVGEHWITESPKSWQWSFVSGFCTTVRRRMRQMRGEDRYTGTGKELALVSIAQQAKNAMWDDFEDLRPHPEGCDCVQCTKKHKAVKLRERRYSYTAAAMGSDAGDKARIASNAKDVKSGGKKQLS